MAAGLLIVAAGFSLVCIWRAFRASCGVAIAISLIPVIESILLVRYVNFSLKTVISPYLQIFFIGGICLVIHFIVKTWFPAIFINRILYAPFITTFTVILSLLVFRYIEGPNPFGDRGGGKSKN
jgi:hypothetical protein